MLTGYHGPILYIDDDEDDQLLFRQAIQKLAITNEFIPFTDCQEALKYLEASTEKPLMILCDVNLPGMNGFELRRCIDEDLFLKQKAIPFLFFSTIASPVQVKEAYQGTVQGFLIKPSNYDELEKQIRLIVDYWKCNLIPEV